MGKYWCPSCFLKNLFCLAPDALPTEEEPDLECLTCRYIHTTIYTEHANGPATSRHAVSKEDRNAATAEMMKDFKETLRVGGFSMENASQPTRRKDRRNGH